ncbi:low molecular weight protein arginine phosphatase [Bacillus sp. FJAT-45350]|uniref:low molecular weight protein arginine phosphatase n=1 Tax=Bacillus sp. FJAT-45350 TaxID=2011014 RepID=UPI000BB67D91|nr:low molecular weight protein arginine phosphatase [Bacillus sp. FJAT-45350]
MERVLFVCTGNTCRSPMAEALLKMKASDRIEVKSAGVHALPTSDASPNSKQVLVEKGIPFNHSSQQITEELINWADIVLTMTEGHQMLISQHFPKATRKIATLKEFVHKGDLVNKDISDPFGGSIEVYRQTAKEIENLLDKMLEDN